MKNIDEILSKEEAISCGYEFDGEIVCYSGEYGQQVCNSSSGSDVPITGIVYELYPNGNINYYCMYANGIKNGDFISFYEDGSLMRRCTMYKGTRHGKTICWYRNGNKKAESESKYSFDLYYQEWDEDGNLIKNIMEPTELGKKMIARYDEAEERWTREGRQ